VLCACICTEDGLLLMQLPTAVAALSALAHGHRLAVFRMLVRVGAEGVAAGEIAREIGVLPNTLSTHLTILGHAGLVQSRRNGRSVIYNADYEGMRDLLDFLVADCCAGRPEICASLVSVAQGCGSSE
jgi:ArsR family transcriptional regulator, arsenate/arsenite/antimonite-responsive transcriptional repressor